MDHMQLTKYGAPKIGIDIILKVLPTHAAESFGLHDKRLVAHTVIPDIRTETGMEVMKDQILYFLRVCANKYI